MKKTIQAWAILYSKTKGGLCHYDINFNNMPSIWFKKKTALYHTNNDKESVVPCTISYSLPLKKQKVMKKGKNEYPKVSDLFY